MDFDWFHEGECLQIKIKAMEKFILGYCLQVVKRWKRCKQATKLGKNIETNVEYTRKYLIYTQY